MQRRELLIVRITSRGTFEVDSLKGDGAITQRGMVTIHRGQMSALTCAVAVLTTLSEQFTASVLYARELRASGWVDHLETQEGYGELRSSRPHPCYRCCQPQTPC